MCASKPSTNAHSWHRKIARATLQAPKVYFYDTGLVLSDAGLRFENLVACHLLKKAQWQQDTCGAAVDLHYIRTKDDGDTLTHLIECKLSDGKPRQATELIAFSTLSDSQHVAQELKRWHGRVAVLDGVCVR